MASCDADGVVKMWDARMVAEIGTMEAGQHPLNSLSLDRSATRMAAASNDGVIKVREDRNNLSRKHRGEARRIPSMFGTICLNVDGHRNVKM